MLKKYTALLSVFSARYTSNIRHRAFYVMDLYGLILQLSKQPRLQELWNEIECLQLYGLSICLFYN